MDEVLRDWKKLSLTNEEREQLKLSKAVFSKKDEHVLAARFMTRRALNIEAVGRTFKPLWRSRGEFEIREAGDHVLLFVFERATDAERVLVSEPWSFDKHVVMLQRYDHSIPTKTLRFTMMKFWVQFHGLPISMLTPEVALELGSKIGNVSQSENPNDMMGGDFLRIRVEVDVSKSLCRGRLVDIGDSEEIWVAFKYEKLANFCYWCGKVSHTDKECELWLANKESMVVEKQGYGAWLRAHPHRVFKC